jgi:hypothetical protein
VEEIDAGPTAGALGDGEWVSDGEERHTEKSRQRSTVSRLVRPEGLLVEIP